MLTSQPSLPLTPARAWAVCVPAHWGPMSLGRGAQRGTVTGADAAACSSEGVSEPKYKWIAGVLCSRPTLCWAVAIHTRLQTPSNFLGAVLPSFMQVLEKIQHFQNQILSSPIFHRYFSIFHRYVFLYFTPLLSLRACSSCFLHAS